MYLPGLGSMHCPVATPPIVGPSLVKLKLYIFGEQKHKMFELIFWLGKKFTEFAYDLCGFFS